METINIANTTNVANTMERKSFGLIFTYKFASFDLAKKIVIDAFRAAGFEDKFIPDDRQPRRAFSKALRASVEGENFLIRAITRNKGAVSMGLVQEEKDEGAKDLKYQVPNIVTLDYSAEAISSKSSFRTQVIIDGYKTSRQELGSIEVALQIKQIVWEAMGISVLCEKAIFIPFKFKSYADRLKVLCDELNKAMPIAQIEIVGVDNDSETRKTIVSQFIKQTLAILDKELDFALKQYQNYANGEIKALRPTTFRKQLKKVEAIEDRIKVYIPVLELNNEEADVLIKKMQDVDAAISRNIELAAKHNERAKRPTIREAFEYAPKN